ncbi:MAG: response regulator [Bacteroidota bacterium]
MVNASFKPYFFWQKKSQTDNSETDQLQYTVASLSRLIEDHDALLHAVARLSRNLLLLMQEPARKLQTLEGTPEDAGQMYKHTLLFQRLTEIVSLHVEVNRLLCNARQSSINFEALNKRVFMAVVEMAEQKQLTVEYGCTGVLPNVTADPEKLLRVLRSLIAYGIAQTAAGGSVKLDVQPDPDAKDTVVCRIKYAGAYLAQNNEDMLARLKASLYAEGPVGLDLTGIRMLISALGGQLSVEEDPGFSTTLVFSLPTAHQFSLDSVTLRRDTLATADDEGLPDEAWTAEELRTTLLQPNPAAEEEPSDPVILLVEDNRDVRYYIKTCLDPHFTVEEAANGEEGLEKAAVLIPDLIIADVMMPKLDGHTLCKQIKQDKQLNHIPVMLSTALSEDEYRLKGYEADADAYLMKPYDSRMLLAQVRSLLANRRHVRNYFSNTVFFEPTNTPVPSVDEAFYAQAKEVVELNMGDKAFDLTRFADAMCMGERQLQRKCKMVLDRSPMAFVRIMRLKRAAQLLEQRAGNIAQVARWVGFNHPRHFSRSFSQLYGKSPRAYMAEY